MWPHHQKSSKIGAVPKSKIGKRHRPKSKDVLQPKTISVFSCREIQKVCFRQQRSFLQHSLLVYDILKPGGACDVVARVLSGVMTGQDVFFRVGPRILGWREDHDTSDEYIQKSEPFPNQKSGKGTVQKSEDVLQPKTISVFSCREIHKSPKSS